MPFYGLNLKTAIHLSFQPLDMNVGKNYKKAGNELINCSYQTKK